MSAIIAVYGRCAADAEMRHTQSGKDMGTCRLAVDINREKEGEDNGPWWVSVIAFGRRADDLSRLRKGNAVSVSGRLQRRFWVTRDGERREAWEIVADTIIAAAVERPGERKGNGDSGAGPQTAGQGYDSMDDSDVPF